MRRSGHSAAWIAHLHGVQGVVSSNLTDPTMVRWGDMPIADEPSSVAFGFCKRFNCNLERSFVKNLSKSLKAFIFLQRCCKNRKFLRVQGRLF